MAECRCRQRVHFRLKTSVFFAPGSIREPNSAPRLSKRRRSRPIRVSPPWWPRFACKAPTPLQHAAAFGSIDTMKLLLDAGADVNAANRRRSTPLHWSLQDEAKVRLLLSRGAAINA